MSRRSRSSARFQAEIAWPAADVTVLFQAVADTFASRLKLPIDPSKWPSAGSGRKDLYSNVTTNFLPWALMLRGSDVETTRRETHGYSGPVALKHHGAWVTLSSQNNPDEETLAFMKQFAVDHGGFLTLDEQTWTTPAGPCLLAGLDVTKWEILKRIGFQHAPAIGAMMDESELLREISGLLADEVSARDEAGPGFKRRT
jgi:hypothetical protein